MAQAIRSQVWPFVSSWIFQLVRASVPVFSAYLLYIASQSEIREVSVGFVVLASALFYIWFKSLSFSRSSNHVEPMALGAIKSLYEKDLLPTYFCTNDGEIIWRNHRANEQVNSQHPPQNTISSVLSDHLPDARATVRRISHQSIKDVVVTERLVGLSGRIDLQIQGNGRVKIWRFDQIPLKKADEQHDTAMLTIGRNGTILFMNKSAKSLIGRRFKSINQLFPDGMPVSGRNLNVQTSNGSIRIRVDVDPLKADRAHLFLTPLDGESEVGNFALKDLPIPLLQLNLDGKIEHANTAALTLLGYAALKGQSLPDVFDSNGILINEWVSQAKDVLATMDAEFLRVRGAKKETFVQVSLKRIDAGSAPCIIAILNDATKLKSLEAQFVQSQKMQAIGQLAGGVAHDFNNLLTAISGHCDLMLLRHDSGDLDYADLMQIHQNANRAAGLVSQLLAFSRKQTLQLEYIDLRDTLSDLTHLLNRLVGEKVTLTLSHDPVLRAVRADKRQLEQVIMNLVVNARDAMPNGGEISIQTEIETLTIPMKRDRVTVPVGDYIVVRVRDAGIGIDEKALQKIFEPFYTTKRVGEGTGLGLSTAYGIVKQTGGFIFADSEIGQGTCFSLLFPACEQNEKPSLEMQINKTKVAEEPCSGVVFLVEDEAPVRAFASRALTMRGFDVIEAESAEKALEKLKDKSVHVDVFVTDVVMPGMDGPTWVKMALEERPNANVVFISGYAEGAFQGRTLVMANSVFLPKPFSLAELTSTVQDQMDARTRMHS